MRSTLFIGCLCLAVVYVYSFTTIEREGSIQKRSPQVYRSPPNVTFSNPSNSSQQFQWTKVNNQWVRVDGKKLPGYSPANVPYNQSGGWNANRNPTPRPRPIEGYGIVVPGNKPQQRPQSPQPQPPQRQNSQPSGGVGWNPNADRALTQDVPHTTPRPVLTTTPAPYVPPQTPPPAYHPPAPTPTLNAPFGSGMGSQQRPQTGFNPDARLSYGGVGPAPVQPNQRAKVTPRPGSNPWGGIF